MTLEVPLTSEQELNLRDQARKAGLTLQDYTVRRLLGDVMSATGSLVSDAEWSAIANEFGSEIAATAPSVSAYALSREAIYSERS